MTRKHLTWLLRLPQRPFSRHDCLSTDRTTSGQAVLMKSMTNMTNKTWCLFAVLILAGWVSSTRAAQPNILFIFTDDQAPWALGVSGNRLAKTPHMDRIAREGAYLPNAYTVTPVCSPSRASLMTSRYGTEVGITDWIHPRSEAQLGLDPKLPVWPRQLQKAGYHTGLVGKWHLGRQDKQHPTRYGFDHFMGHREGGWSSVNPTLEKDGKNQKFEGLTADVLADEALGFIRSHVKSPSDSPFLLCWHTRAPHARWLPVAPEDMAPYKGVDVPIPNPNFPNLDVPRVKRMTREYLASVRSVDRNVGRILKMLDELKLASNTIVIFSSDHGYSMGHNGIWHKGNGHWVLKPPPPAKPNIPRGQRPNMYDNSIKVPTMIRWPGVIKPGTVVPQTVSNLDWFPTILAMAGVKTQPSWKLRGRDFTLLLKGRKPADWDNTYYAQYSTHHQSRTHMRMISTGQWKLIRDFLNPSRDELYHLEKDPAEANNLVGSTDPKVRSVLSDLHRRLVARMKTIGDQVHEVR